jgi:hypothetical protein
MHTVTLTKAVLTAGVVSAAGPLSTTMLSTFGGPGVAMTCVAGGGGAGGGGPLVVPLPPQPARITRGVTIRARNLRTACPLFFCGD